MSFFRVRESFCYSAYVPPVTELLLTNSNVFLFNSFARYMTMQEKKILARCISNEQEIRDNHAFIWDNQALIWKKFHTLLDLVRYFSSSFSW